METLRTFAASTLLALTGCAAARAQSPLSDFMLEVNGVPCVADTASRILYSTIIPGAEQEITIGLAAGQGLIVDGTYVENGQEIRVSDFRAPLPITFVTDRKPMGGEKRASTVT